jgi:hypothetical protein
MILKNEENWVRFEVLIALAIKSVFWDVKPCGLVESYQRFRGTLPQKTNLHRNINLLRPVRPSLSCLRFLSVAKEKICFKDVKIVCIGIISL